MPIQIFDQTVGILARFLDGGASRHQAIAANIANQDTPGYRAVDVSFQEALGAAAESALAPLPTHPGHLSTDPTAATEITSTAAGRSSRLDGNTVNVEHEMAKLAENSLMYQAGTELLSAKFRLLKTAIREGR
jgi:flagellar basal-body rod protein FlgB